LGEQHQAESSLSKSSKGSTSPWTPSKVNIGKYRLFENPGSSISRDKAVDSQKSEYDTQDGFIKLVEVITPSAYKCQLPVLTAEKVDNFSMNRRKVSEQIESLYHAKNMELKRGSFQESTLHIVIIP